MPRWTPLLLVACGGPSPEVGDLDLVAVPASGMSLERAQADVQSLVLGPCEGEPVEIAVDRTLNLLLPEPLPVPVGEYCDLGLALAEAPFDGSVRLGGTLDGVPFELALDPGLATRDVDLVYASDTEGILALDLALLVDADRADVVAAGVVAPDDALGGVLADRVGDALVWFDTPEEARSVYVDLWPDIDVSVEADVDVRGCDRRPVAVFSDGRSSGCNHRDRDPTTGTTGTATGGTGTGGTGTGGTGTGGTGTGGTGTGGGGGGGSDGGGGCGGGGGGGGGEGGCGGGGGGGGGCGGGGGGGGCDGGGGSSCGGGGGGSSCDCDVDTCSTVGLAPVGWVWLATFLALRRRRPA